MKRKPLLRLAQGHLSCLVACLWVGLAVSLPLSSSAQVPGSLTFHAEDPSQNVVFNPEQATNRYLADFVRWAIEDIANPPGPEAVLALGSSSMRLWNTIKEDLAPLEIIHRGFGGSRMKDVVEMQSFFDRYDVDTILVYQGDNDLSGPWTNVEDHFMADVRQFVAHVHQRRPDTEIYFISPKPSPSRTAALPRYLEAGRQLQEMAAADPRLHFIDVYTLMVDEQGEPLESIFKGDRLHMNEEGYRLWTQAVREALLD